MATTEFEQGIREQISWGEETTYGTQVAPTEIVGKDVEIIPQFDQGWLEIMQAGDDKVTLHELVQGPLSLPYQLRFKVVNWKFLKLLFSSVVNAGSGPYTHTYSQGSTLNSYTVQWGKRRGTDKAINLLGSVCKGGTIRWQKATGGGSEGFIQVTLNMHAQDYANGSITSLSPLSNSPFQYRHVTVTLNNSDVVEINNGELNFDLGVNPDQDSRYANATLDRKIGEPIITAARYNGRVNVNVKNNTWEALWEAAAAVEDCEITFVKSASDKAEFSFTNLYPTGPGYAETNIGGVNNVDAPFTIDEISAVVTDSAATH